ncbi:Cadherin-9 [Liparis tanakae]|uniref:Cadherin-9 n=1 Tax=Liparis tanakae TaxID=230148 RepID=A0A4Z2EM35_9TELE|nr:Cadherin-9 [Liparis tanakae]
MDRSEVTDRSDLMESVQLHSNMDRGEGNVKYVLTGDGAGSLFLIDEKSGDIHATKRLDREEKAMYTLNAKVLDRRTNLELEPDTEFNIKIHDINDNEPKFAKEIYFASVPEMSEVERTNYKYIKHRKHATRQ